MPLLLACEAGGTERSTPPAVAETQLSTPTAPVTPGSAVLERYCRHALEAEAFVKELDEGEVWANQDRMANLRAFEIEALFSADATDLRREGRDVEATNVADHSRVLRQYFNSWVGRGPNPGAEVDILRDYYRASDPARSMCR